MGFDEEPDDAHGDDYRARPHDHLVEPLFGGLGHGAESKGEARAEEPRRVAALLAALVRACRRVVPGGR